MVELPGGSVRSATANVSLRSVGVEERADAIRGIVLAAADGRAVRLEEVATCGTGSRTRR
jgi:multidrug efflux pump subunit AcrB